MIEPRKPLTKFEFAQLVLEQGGLCGCGCGAKLVFKPKQIRDEHLVQLSLGGTNALKNRSLWCLDCTKPKDKADARARAKVRSLTGVNKPKRKAEIKSRGFQPAHQGHTAWGKPRSGNGGGFNRGYKPTVRHDD